MRDAPAGAKVVSIWKNSEAGIPNWYDQKKLLSITAKCGGPCCTLNTRNTDLGEEG
jgi:hypothetical protein